mgnify:CR=1 FL=1
MRVAGSRPRSQPLAAGRAHDTLAQNATRAIVHPLGPLHEAPLDLSRTPEFHARVYEIARAIPPGETLTYGELARFIGRPEAAASSSVSPNGSVSAGLMKRASLPPTPASITVRHDHFGHPSVEKLMG